MSYPKYDIDIDIDINIRIHVLRLDQDPLSASGLHFDSISYLTSRTRSQPRFSIAQVDNTKIPLQLTIHGASSVDNHLLLIWSRPSSLCGDGVHLRIWPPTISSWKHASIKTVESSSIDTQLPIRPKPLLRPEMPILQTYKPRSKNLVGSSDPYASSFCAALRERQ